MIFLPLPFVVALFLLTLLLQLLRRGEAGGPPGRLFALLIAAYALQSVLVGLRWGYDLRAVLPAMAVVASLNPPLTWLCFRRLAAEAPPRAWPHLLAPVACALLLGLWRDAVGPLIMLIYLGYGLALLWLARLGPDGLVASRLDGALRSYRALRITGFALIGSAASDVLISLDLAAGGTHAGLIVAVLDGLVLLALGAAASVAGADSVTVEPDPEPAAPSADLAETAAAVDAAMAERGLFRDPELNLGKLARRLRLPARQVSQAINRQHGMSVSQYVNGHRVRAACALLADSEAPVGAVMFEAGFLTKSNFNREFLRVTGESPSAWRQRRRTAPGAG